MFTLWLNLLIESEKPSFSTFFAISRLRGLTFLCLLPLIIFTLYHRLHCLVFKVQLILSLTLSRLVEMRRIELLTPCLQGRCSPSWATPPNEFNWKLTMENWKFWIEIPGLCKSFDHTLKFVQIVISFWPPRTLYPKIIKNLALA